MKKLLALAIVAMSVGTAFADPSVLIQQRAYGSGMPSVPGTQGTPVVKETQASSALPDGLYYVPQYLPGYPTAAVIFPRVIDVSCVRAKAGNVSCEGYNWLPEYGRGEYLLIRPTVKETPIQITPPVKIVKKKPKE
jgi:hypothetical protein